MRVVQKGILGTAISYGLLLPIPYPEKFDEDLKVLARCINHLVAVGTAPIALACKSALNSQDDRATVTAVELDAIGLDDFSNLKLLWESYCRSQWLGESLILAGESYKRDTVTTSDAVEHVNNLLSSYVLSDSECLYSTLDGETFLAEMKKPINMFETGYRLFDDLIRFRPGMYVVLGARTSVGKTFLALNLAYRMIKHKVGYISLEMSSYEIYRRLLAMDARISLDAIDLREEGEQLALVNHLEETIGGKLFIDDSCTVTLGNLQRTIEMMVKQQGVSVVFIDYLQLIHAKGSRVEAVTAISRQCKIAAQKYGIAVVALSQINRASMERVEGQVQPPELHHLRDSGALEQDADVVVLMHRERLHDEEFSVSVAKNRHGPVSDWDQWRMASTGNIYEN